MRCTEPKSTASHTRDLSDDPLWDLSNDIPVPDVPVVIPSKALVFEVPLDRELTLIRSAGTPLARWIRESRQTCTGRRMSAPPVPPNFKISPS